MEKARFMKLFSSFLAFVLVLSLLMPYAASANTVDELQSLTESTETADKAEGAAKKPFKEDAYSESIMQQKSAIAEQLNLLGGDAKLHEQLQNVSGQQEVPVIIHLSERSVALEKGIKKLKGQQLSSTEAAAIKQKARTQQINAKKEMMIKGITFKEGFSYDTVLNGMSGKVKADDIPKLLEVTGVKLVEPDTTVYAYELGKANANSKLNNLKKPVPGESKLEEKAKPGLGSPIPGQVSPAMDTSISFLGIEQLWNEGIEGQGIKVAVLDTGIDKDHPDFQGIYKGGKNFVPHNGTDYARPRADNDGSETSPADRPSHRPEFDSDGRAFYTSHGTHVAGTIAAIGNNPYGIKGIAPKVDLYSYRVLGAYGSGSTSGIIKAIETAVIEEMDVINLSLGGGSNSETDGASFAINNAMLAGTIAVVATGNSGPNRGTMGTPATSRLGIAVGNTTNPEAHYDGQVNITAGDYSLSKTLNLMGTTFGQDLAAQLNGEYEIVAVPGVGKPADYNGLDVSGKVALVSRGEIAFVDKIAAAKDKGAVAVIVHNFAGGSNAPGPSGTFLGDSFDFIPTFDMSQTDGEAIRTALQQANGTISFGSFNVTLTEGDEVNNSSSRGPSRPNFDIKPDVTAPGTNIMSTIPMYKADFPDASYETAFDRKTGTSMATPHIAGIAALVQQANPSWSPFDVKVALSNTAKVLDTKKYDVFAQGAGRVQPYAAAHPNILAYAIDTANNDGQIVENLKGTVTFGPQKLDQNLSVTKQIRVKAINGGGTYNATVEMTKTFGDATVTVDKPTFTLSGEQLLNVTLTASKRNTTAGDEVLGYIHITGNGANISLPFAADFGGISATEIRDMNINETDLSFNGDGVKDEAMLTFKITGDVGMNFIEIWDIMDPEGGVYGDGYIGYLHAGQSLGAGSYQLPIRGQYSPWSGEPQTTIPDGLYTIDFTAQTASGNPPVISDYVGPVVVKSEAGTITGAIEGTTATGQIDDAYIGYQQELENYGLGYDINTKLKASYEVKEGEEVVASGQAKLAQDGAYTFELPELNKAKHSVIVKYEDAAGNKAQEIIYNAGDQVEDEVDYTVSFEAVELELEGTEQLTVTETITKADGTKEEKDVTAEAEFVSADESIATVANGLVTAVAPGTTEITVTYKEFTKAIPVEVKEPAQGEEKVTYSVNKMSVKLGVDQTEQLIVTKTTEKPDGTIVEEDVTETGKYNVVNNTIAKINKGLITAIKPGKTKARVMIPGQETIFVDIEVTAQAKDIISYSVNKKNLVLGVGQQEQLYVTQKTVKPDGTVVEKDVTSQLRYNVVDNTYATVVKGTVTAKQAGLTQVRIHSIPEHEDIYVYLEVVELPQNIVTYSANKTHLTIGEGQQEQLYVTETTVTPDGEVFERDVTGAAKYSVIDNTVATVKKGLVSAAKAGKSQVRIVINEKETLYVYLEVTKAPQNKVSYELSQTELVMAVGEQLQLKVKETTVTPEGKTTERDATVDTTFEVVNDAIASVQMGLVTAKKPGKTQVRIVLPSGEAILAYLEVTGAAAAPDSVTYAVNQEQFALNAGDTAQVAVTETTTKADGTATDRDVTGEATFTSGDASIATVENGTITAIGAGTTTITATFKDFTATIAVEVAAVPEVPTDTVEYSVNKTDVNLGVGEQDRLLVLETTTKPNGDVTMRNITDEASFEVADASIAAIDRGTVVGLGIGNTTIAVKYAEFFQLVNVSVEGAPVVQSPAQKITMDSIAAELDNNKKNPITIDLSSAEATVEVEIDASALEAIKKSEKDLILQKDGAVITFEDDAVEELLKQTRGDVTIVITKSDASHIDKAISDMYSLEFFSGFGDSKQLLGSYKEDIEIILPVDASKIVSENKVAVLNVITNKTSNAKYKNGQFTFKTEKAGSFVAINKK
ncbi:S8 family serine peptidase [Sporosarcina cyprini]|uniref:S8 family serine peptidase n=1 Tax=Sporosarcina cyprini TaxID=2910523 RepID=UPI00300CFA91